MPAVPRLLTPATLQRGQRPPILASAESSDTERPLSVDFLSEIGVANSYGRDCMYEGLHYGCFSNFDLAVESSQVVECLDTRKEEIGAALHSCESRQALYLSSDRPLWDRHIVSAVLGTDDRIAFVA
jgi:hypothetical protein